MNVYIDLFVVFFKIGLFSFGGGYAVLSLIKKEVVEKYAWLSVGEFTEIVALSQITPGPIGLNSATHVGFKVTGTALGSLTATTAVVLPSVLIILLILAFLNKFKESLIVKRVFKALRPTVIGLIIAAGLSLCTVENFKDSKSYILFVIAIIGSVFFKLGPIMLIVGSGILGIIMYS